MCIFDSKCKFWKSCNCFSKGSFVCTKTKGNYYGTSRQGGCYRDLEEKGKDSPYWLSKEATV